MLEDMDTPWAGSSEDLLFVSLHATDCLLCCESGMDRWPFSVTIERGKRVAV